MSNLIDQASLVMIPSGYKEDKIYSQVPTDGSGDLTFTRASDGTRVNSQGLVERVPWNLATYSEDFTNGWPVTATITANTTTNPINGATNADTITGWGFIGKSIASIGVNTFFVYAKANSASVIRLNVYDGSTDRGADYNLSTGAISGVYGSPISTNAENVGNGWWKISITTNNANYSYVQIHRDSSGTCYIWGAQLNEGSTAKPYFPTTDRQNVPRLDYSGGCPSLLLEPQRTNLFTYSEEFDNGAWSPIGSTITANNTTSPDGTQNADKITEDSSNGLHLFYNTNGVSAGAGTWTISIFYKKGTRRYFAIKMQIGLSSYTQVFDADGLTTGGSSSNGLTSVSSTIVSMGNGWVRATLTGTDAIGVGGGYGIFSLSNSLNPSFDPTNYNPTYQGSSSEYGYFWGAQLE